MSKLVIIGNGISGVTVARHVRKLSDMNILIISAETEHFFSRTALMYVFMGHMKFEHTKPYEDHFWQKNRIDLKQGQITDINTDEKILTLASGEHIDYSQLVLATGSQSNKFGWPGQDLPGVQTLFSYQDLELMENNSKYAKRAVMVGGGLIGVEMAEMLISRGIQVTFLVREDRFWGNILPHGEAELVQKEYKKKIPFTKSELYEATSIPGTIKKAKNIWSGMKYTAGKVKGYLNKLENVLRHYNVFL